MIMKKYKIGVLIYTYNRIDDAKINMEIIRNVWARTKLFSDIIIAHCYNGNKKWYPKKYLEDDLIRISNSGHFQGASELIDAGIKKIKHRFRNLEYVIVLAADTWLMKPNYIFNILIKMREKELYWATCAWGRKGMNKIEDVGAAIDFFIIDVKWAKKYKMFPLNYKKFKEKYGELFLYHKGQNISLEKLIFARYLQAIYNQYKTNVQLRHLGISRILTLKDREPVHKNNKWHRSLYWPKIGLITHHEPELKKKILKKYKIAKGKNIKKLLTNKDLNYYNNIRKFDYNIN